jgi:3-oxo-5-alpha-steroid 4-dehydrogenase 1
MGPFEESLYRVLVWTGFAGAALVFVLLCFVTAPYGRYARQGWGPRINSAIGWVLMEVPAVLVFGACFMGQGGPDNATPWVFLVLWEIHYVHRTFIFPLRMRSSGKTTPVAVVAMAVGFNTYNGYLNGRYLNVFENAYPTSWLVDPRFLAGLTLFVLGLIMNVRADQRLRALRRPAEGTYRIPEGGLFRWVSCPNYLGEIVEWTGWALATSSMAGLVFAVWTAANLVPRALAHHKWYLEHFTGYPPERKALVPYLF